MFVKIGLSFIAKRQQFVVASEIPGSRWRSAIGTCFRGFEPLVGDGDLGFGVQ